MSKDPAFLFYSKEWLEGTAEMTSEEKGVYIDLLAHQHQKGSLPPEIKKLAKLSGNSEKEFLLIWKEISTKFIPNGSNRLVNRKLNIIVTERFDRAWRNKIVGTLASVIKYSNQPYEINLQIKKKFRVEDFLLVEDHKLTETITEWYTKWFKSIANANEDANANNKINNSVVETRVFGGKFEFSLDLKLPDEDLESLELNQFTKTGNKNSAFIKNHWKIFVHERMCDPPEVKTNYHTVKDLTKYFKNFLRDRHPKINGTDNSKINRNSKSAGAYDLLEKARANAELIAGRNKNT